ncbi:hypothetical protein BDV93DRAFT_610926 [Ceratobasidium sp. AG-I]|nr:hypothetical protein BDV93DRAFT_610926 [Ceratobasidium sp. AG-I]
MTDTLEPMDGSIISEEPSELTAAEDKAARKARRQTAIYPNTLRTAPKPFSRSAAKRESVMALGSIEHLQHYFTKTGIAAKQNPMGRRKGLVPAIGGARHVRAASSVTSIPELPPSPMVPTSSSRPPFMHLPKTYEVDPAQLRPGVVRDLKAVEHAWGLDRSGSTSNEVEKEQPKFDVLSTLRITTRAIRSVRDYVVSLPDDHPTHTGKVQGPYRHPAFGAPSRPMPVSMNSGAQSLASLLQQTASSAPAAGLVSPKPRLSGLPGSPSLRPTVIPGSPSKLPGSPSLRPVGLPTSPSPRPSLLPTISVQNTGNSGGMLSVQNTGGGSGMLSAQHTGSGAGLLAFPSKPEEPLALVRKAAVEVLVALRGLEERARVSVDAEQAHGHGHVQEASSQSQDAPSVSSRSATPATFLSGDDGERESATSLSTSTFSPPPRPRPRLTIPTDSGGGSSGTETLLVHGRGAVQIWSDSDSGDDLAPDEPEKREVWDERLVLGGGWLYKSNLGEDEVKSERENVRVYLDVVDGVLFGGARGGRRGWERERRKPRKSDIGEGSIVSEDEDEGGMGGRRVSGSLGEAMRLLSLVEDESMLEEVGEEDEGGEGDDVPEWATVEPFGSDLIARTNALLQHFLPPTLAPFLPTPATREALLSCLSDGQLLCVAYNSAVRKSKKAWGFINAQSIHETTSVNITAEEKAAGSWTFRRKENLGLWAAALKLRYVIDIVPADQQSNHPTRHFHRAPLTPVEPGDGDGSFGANVFSPIVIAKKEKGWEDMLERAIWAWVNAVVTETKDSAGMV